MTVYGPYRRSDGRAHVIHYNDGKRRTQSYPRYLMEQHLGRQLKSWEQVDHINNDPTDDRIENFQLLTQAKNIRKSKQAEMMDFECPVCGTLFELEARRYRSNQLKQKKNGPYCSKSCSGKIHH